MVEHLEISANQGIEVPFPPSWIDRLITWIDNLPWPAWLFYLLSTLAIVVLGNMLFWIDGSIPIGSVDRIITIFAIIVFYWLALYQYLTRVASRSLLIFRPLLEIDDSEIARIDYELATLPRWLGWLAIPLGFAMATATILSDPASFGGLVPKTALPYIGDIAIAGFLASTFLCLILRSIRQLWMVRRLHAQATSINLLNLDPVHAFSALTARTGIGVILLLILAYFLDPPTLDTTLDIFITAATLFVAIAVFVLPVIGIRDQLEEEKHRVLDFTSVLLQTTSDSFHSKVEKRDYRDLEGMETAITTLIRERELYSRISTWPWGAGTIRGFASTLLLPIFLLLVARFIERFF
jgi:hypothetical protein